MPTQRKRIGFLPSCEVQIIINKICNHNKLSQSKVTGILVEEALIYRGVLNTSLKDLSFDFDSNESEGLLTGNKKVNREISNDEENFNVYNGSLNEEMQMINDFIEFKFFKNIMNKNKKKIKQ